jgi:hypothetical protein
LRNRACFEGKLINSPVELIRYSAVFMKYWAGLNPSADQELIRRGADELINRAMVFGFQLMRKDLTLEMKMLALSDLPATIFRLWLLCALFIWASVAPSPSSLDLACLNTCFVLILVSF